MSVDSTTTERRDLEKNDKDPLQNDAVQRASPSSAQVADENTPNERSDTDDPSTYPEGGLRAWLVAFGAFCGMFAGFGVLNSIGIFNAYLQNNQLRGEDESTVSWIFSIYSFMCFFCGLQIGPIFDAKGPRMLILSGSVLLVLSVMLLGLCTGMSQ